MQRPLKINWSASFRPHKGLFVSLTSASASNKLKLKWIFLIKWMDSRPDFFSKREVFGLDWSLGCLICSENLEEKEKSFNNYFGSFLPHAHTLVHIHAPPHTHTHTRTYTYAQPNASACTCSLSPSLIHLVMKFLAWTSDTKAEAPPAQQEISAASQFNRNWKIPQMSMENWSTRDGLKSLSWVKLSQAKARAFLAYFWLNCNFGTLLHPLDKAETKKLGETKLLKSLYRAITLIVIKYLICCVLDILRHYILCRLCFFCCYAFIFLLKNQKCCTFSNDLIKDTLQRDRKRRKKAQHMPGIELTSFAPQECARPLCYNRCLLLCPSW